VISTRTQQTAFTHFSKLSHQIYFILRSISTAFSTLMLMVRGQEGHPTCKRKLLLHNPLAWQLT